MLQATSSKLDQVMAREKVCHCEFRAKCTCEAAKAFMEPLDDGVCQRHCDYGNSCQSMQKACPKLKFTCDRKAMAWSCDSRALLQAHSGSHNDPQEGPSSEAKEKVQEKKSKEEKEEGGNEDNAKASEKKGGKEEKEEGGNEDKAKSGDKADAEGSEEDDSQASENSGDSGEKADAEGGEAGDSQPSESSGDSGEKTDAEGGEAGEASENSGEAEEKPDAEGGEGDQPDASGSSGDSGEKVDAKKGEKGKAAKVTSGSSGNSTEKSKGVKKNATKASEGSDDVGGKADAASENSTDAEGDVIAPFGKEDTARELQKRASSSQDTLVDAIENSMVAEMKRSIFRSLSRLRAAEIKEFDTIARLETKAFDEFNDNFQYRDQNPLKYIGEEEGEVSQDKLSGFH